MSWQKILARGFSSSSELLKFLELPVQLANQSAEKQFVTRVPRGFAARMQVGNQHDPLLLQVLASVQENHVDSAYVADPLEEEKSNPIPGLMHKYHGRVLLTLTGICAINCRYCFRRHFPYQENNPGRNGWQTVVEYIRKDRSINEVILSGGDPLLAADNVVADLLSQLASIAHIRTVRIHTRIPVVLPERINEPLLTLLRTTPLRKVIVFHSNHAQEINPDVKDVCMALRDSGCHLLNQSVLLKGVNDCAQTLVHLSEALFDCGVLPYYLHVLDKVAGAAHFDLPTETALVIYEQLQALLPGYLLPRLAREEPRKSSKTLLRP